MLEITSRGNANETTARRHLPPSPPHQPLSKRQTTGIASEARCVKPKPRAPRAGTRAAAATRELCRVRRTANAERPRDPSAPLRGASPGELKTGAQTVPLTLQQRFSQRPEHRSNSSARQWQTDTQNVVCATTECHSASLDMDLEDVMLCDLSQSQRDKHRMIPPVRGPRGAEFAETGSRRRCQGRTCGLGGSTSRPWRRQRGPAAGTAHVLSERRHPQVTVRRQEMGIFRTIPWAADRDAPRGQPIPCKTETFAGALRPADQSTAGMSTSVQTQPNT